MENQLFKEIVTNSTTTKISWKSLEFLNKSNFMLLLVLFISVLVLLQKWIRSFCKPKSSKGKLLEGPPKLPVFGSLHHLIKPGVDKLQLLLDWSLKYGPIYNLTLYIEDFVVINDPVIIQKVLGSSNPAHLEKHRFLYDVILTDALDKGLLGSDVQTWAPHRKTLSRAFTFKSLNSHLAIMNSYMGEFISQFGLTVDNTQNETKSTSNYFDELLHFNTIKIILDVLTGKDIYTEEEINIFTDAFQIAKEITAQKINQPWLLFNLVWKFSPVRKKLEKSLATLKTFLENATRRKRKMRAENAIDYFGVDDGDQASKSIVDDMLDAGMSDKEILDEFLTMILAGHETTCSAVSFLFLNLALNPHQQELCRDEVDKILGREGRPAGDDLSMKDVCDLKHLERCVQESLRLTPVVPTLARQIWEPIKVENDIELSAGTGIFILPWTVHRNPEIYPNPEKFDPDRFLPENCVARHPYAYIPFSAGPRNCIGWKFAMIEIKVIAARILRHFQIFTEHTSLKDSRLELEVPTLVPSAGFKFSFKRRN